MPFATNRWILYERAKQVFLDNHPEASQAEYHAYILAIIRKLEL